MLARMVPRGQFYAMDPASHNLEEERPEDFYVLVTAFLNQEG